MSENNQAAEPSRKRRRTKPWNWSIYTTSVHDIASLLVPESGSRRAGSRRGLVLSDTSSDEDEDDGEEEEEEEEEEEGNGLDGEREAGQNRTNGNDHAEGYSQRSRRGWETRRTRKSLRNRWLEKSESPEPPAFPNNDLIHALHAHASEFYTRYDLLIPQTRKKRHTHHPSKKRLLLEAEASFAPSPLPLPPPQPPVIGDSSIINGDGTSGGEGQEVIRAQRRSARFAESQATPTRETFGPSQAATAPKDSGREKYKRRDMYRALDGSAMVALGILVEEHISSQLRRAGYAPPTDRQPPPPPPHQ